MDGYKHAGEALENWRKEQDKRIAELEQERNLAEGRIDELEQENERLRDALLAFKKQYPNSPWIHNQVDEAIRAELEK